MKNNRKIQLIISFLLVAAVSLLPYVAMAQCPNPDDADCPIDGGLSLLLAAGVGYGVKKYRDVKKSREEDFKARV